MPTPALPAALRAPMNRRDLFRLGGVIGGGIASAGQTLLEALDRHMRPQSLMLPEIRTSVLGGDSVALGAIRLGLNHVESELFSFLSPPAQHQDRHMYRR